jgi:hypothetical protein
MGYNIQVLARIYWTDNGSVISIEYSAYNNYQLIYNSKHVNKATNYQTDHYSDP